MKLASRIFRRSDWYVTSKFGWRNCPYHGKEYHNGVDYGTNLKKLPQYALEDGYVQLVHKGNSGYGNYVWVRYPRLNISLLHAHLDSISVEKGQKVKEGTLIGYTGKTGNATGIHLHLGMTKIGSNKWLNPHDYDYQAPKVSNDKPKEETKSDKNKKETSKIIHTVKSGENLTSIAKKYGTNWKKIYNDNKSLIDKEAKSHGIKDKFYNYIYPGQKLIINK